MGALSSNFLLVGGMRKSVDCGGLGDDRYSAFDSWSGTVGTPGGDVGSI